MARPRVFDRVDEDVIRRLEKRQSWPVALLARLLDCHETTLYRYLDRGILDRDERGIETDSLVTLLKKRA